MTFGISPLTFDALVARGQAVTGLPRTVSDRLLPDVEKGRINFMFTRFAFGNQGYPRVLRSIDLFARRCMPVLAESDKEFAAA